MMIETLIIGSGVAAAAIAQRLLSKNPNHAITILEASTSVKLKDYGLWQDFMLSGVTNYDKYNDLPYPERDKAGENLNIGSTTVPLENSRCMVFGGTTIHWGGWSFRMKPEDFYLFSNVGKGIDWPINYDDLEDYYGQAESYIGVSGDSEEMITPRHAKYPYPAFPYTLEDEGVYHAMNALGITPSHLPIARHGITDTVSEHAPCKTTGTCRYCPFGARYAATNYLNDMLDGGFYPQFQVRLNAVVEEILMANKQQATGVRYYDKDTKSTIELEAKRIIVAGGAIESPKLLMRSTSEYWNKGIGNDYDLLGRYLITHPYYIINATLPSNPQNLQPEMDFPTLCSRHFDSPEEQAKGKFLLVNPPSSRSSSVDVAYMMRQGESRTTMNQNIAGKHHIQMHGMVEVFSEFDNRIMILNKPNHIGLPQTIVDYSKAADFDLRIQEIQGHINQIFAKMGATASAAKPYVSWRADHAACTARMSKDESQGVVDKDLKIHGTDNIYVCSNAAFASLGTVNPTLTLSALSLRLADHLSAT
jgi:choline dehydrogenase-like flavoprotein